MKRIIIICEGPTEQEFCKDVLQYHFNAQNCLLHCPTIKKSGGGIVAWNILRKQIENHLNQDKGAFVTTLIDYYGIQVKHQFPEWDLVKNISNKNARLDALEKALLQSVDASFHHRFIPYIQLHEFEALLFNNLDVFTENVPPDDLLNKDELTQIINNNPNPELINDTPENSPSFRLKRLIKGYNKIVYGAVLAESIGLARIRSKSPRFNKWITVLEAK